jgi:rSAM/selenodomain-associated transferase 2
LLHPQLSIIIPVRNDAEPLATLLAHLRDSMGAPDRSVQVIVVDGESQDDSMSIAGRAGALVVRSSAGRGRQLNAGLQAASGDWLWMLHADALPSTAAIEWIRQRRLPGWGRFDVSFDDDGVQMRLVAGMMNLRSRVSGICTGDQGIFAHRRLLERIGGIPEQPLMEDIELCRRLSQLCPPACPSLTVQTSARRWRHNGWLKTVLAMWRYRLRYWSGVPAETLAGEYHED